MSTGVAEPARAAGGVMEVVVGRVARTHGIRGEVAVELRTDEPDRRFAPGTVLQVGELGVRRLTVRTARAQGTRLLVSFTGIDDRGAAEELRGALLSVDVEEGDRPTDPEEFYDRQLVGLPALTTDGVAVGVVSEVMHLPAQDLLVLRDSAGAEVLVPFVAELVPDVDLDAGRIVIADRPGLLEDSAAEI